MTNKENSNVILSQEGRIQSYTNESVKRGLNLANRLFINSRSKINQEVTEQYTKKQNHQWNHFCKITHPKGKITSVSISSEDNLIGVIDSWSTFNFFALKDETFSLSHNPFLGHYKKFSDFNILNYDQSETERCNSFKKYGENFNIVAVEKSQKLISIKDYEIKIWNFKNRTLESKISSAYNPLVNTLDKIIVYENNDANIQVWSIDKDRIIFEIETDFDSIEHISLSGDGKQLAVSGLKTVGGDHEKDEYINEHSIKIWNISINSLPIQVNKFTDTKNIIRSPKVYLDEKGKVLVSVDDRDFFGSNLFSIGIWDLLSENLLYQLELNDDFIIATKKEHLIHISEADKNKIIVRDLTTGKIIKIIQNEDTRIFNVSCDGEVIACASSEKNINRINIWNIKTGKLLYELSELESSVKDLIFSQDSKSLISIHWNGSANIWKLTKDLNEAGSSFNCFTLDFQMVSEGLIGIDPEGFLQNGIDAFEKNKLEDSIENLTMALDHNPRNGYAYIYRARARYGLGDKQNAVKDFSKALLINPDYAEVYYYRGLIQAELNNFSKAFEDYSEAIRINPIFLNAYNSRSSVRSALGDYQGAIEDIQKAKNLNL